MELIKTLVLIRQSILGETMNKYLIATFFILGAISFHGTATALSTLTGQACPNLPSVTTGMKCKDLGGVTGAAAILISQDCYNNDLNGSMKDTCKVALCNGACVCRNNGFCGSGGGGGITPTLGCSDCVSSINWGVVSTLSGVQSGTPVMKSGASSLAGCTSCKATVYRCASGYYADTNLVRPVQGMPEACVSTKPTYCKPCPSAPDYDLGDDMAPAGAPEHVNSPAGFAEITDCYVKANSDIKTKIGTYVYTSNCKYTN